MDLVMMESKTVTCNFYKWRILLEFYSKDYYVRHSKILSGRRKRLKKNITVNFVRMIACIFVVLIHCPFPEALGEYTAALARFAVPFFVLVTGFYSYNADRGICMTKAKTGVKKTSILIVTCLVISTILNSIAEKVGGGGAFDWLLPNLTLKNAAMFILFNRLSFANWAIWYLFAILYVYLIYILLLKHNLLITACKLAPLLLMFNIIIQELLNLPWYVAGNFLFTVLPFFLIGRWINEEEVSPSRKWMYGVLIVSTGVVLLEQFMFGRSALYAGSIGVSLSIFFLAKDDILAERKWAKYVGRIGEYFSMPIYLCHCGIIQILNELTEKGYVVISPYIAPLVIIMASIILSLPYVLIKEQLYQRRMNK